MTSLLCESLLHDATSRELQTILQRKKLDSDYKLSRIFHSQNNIPPILGLDTIIQPGTRHHHHLRQSQRKGSNSKGNDCVFSTSNTRTYCYKGGRDSISLVINKHFRLLVISLLDCGKCNVKDERRWKTKDRNRRPYCICCKLSAFENKNQHRVFKPFFPPLLSSLFTLPSPLLLQLHQYDDTFALNP